MEASQVDFFCAAARRTLEDVELDLVLLWEDIAYKTAPHISPQMFRRFMLAPYKRLTGFIREHGIKLIFVDSDGYAEPLIPLWLEGGVNGLYHLGRASRWRSIRNC